MKRWRKDEGNPYETAFRKLGHLHTMDRQIDHVNVDFEEQHCLCPLVRSGL